MSKSECNGESGGESEGTGGSKGEDESEYPGAHKDAGTSRGK